MEWNISEADFAVTLIHRNNSLLLCIVKAMKAFISNVYYSSSLIGRQMNIQELNTTSYWVDRRSVAIIHCLQWGPARFLTKSFCCNFLTTWIFMSGLGKEVQRKSYIKYSKYIVGRSGNNLGSFWARNNLTKIKNIENTSTGQDITLLDI